MKYLTTSEVAAIIRTSDETVRQLCRSGALKSFQIKKHYRISSDSFEAWIKAQETKPEISDDSDSNGQSTPAPRLRKTSRLNSNRLTPISENFYPNLPKLNGLSN